MGQDKKQLKKLLDFVTELYEDPENREFAAGIRSLVLGDRDFLRSRRLDGMKDLPEEADDPIRKIEKYLSLDFDIDGREFPDYSFIADESVKGRLESDFREMLRYRFGTRGHRVDFPEFCRYATLQFELLLNYYYGRKYGSDIRELLDVIVTNFPKFVPGEYMTNVSSIPARTKVYQLRHEIDWPSAQSNTILNCYEVRNKQSHRSLIPDKDRIAEYESLLRKGKVWDGYRNWPRIPAAVDKGVLTQKQLDEYIFQRWCDREPFEEVTSTVGKLAASISCALA